MKKITEKRIEEIKALVISLVYGILNTVTGIREEFNMDYSLLEDSQEFKLFSDLRVKIEKEKSEKEKLPKLEFNRLASVLFGVMTLTDSPLSISSYLEVSNTEYVRINKSGNNVSESKWYGLKLLSTLEYFGIVNVDKTNKVIRLTEKGLTFKESLLDTPKVS